MGRPLDDGVYRNCHTPGIGEQRTKGSTYFPMLGQVESPVNCVAASETAFWPEEAWATFR